MSSPLLQTSQDDPDAPKHNLKARKDRVIQPISAQAATSDDLLAELREKTAELASKVDGPETPEDRVLELTDDNEEPEAIIEKLEAVKDTKSAVENPTGEMELKQQNPAVDLIRQKLTKIYNIEPVALKEAEEVYEVPEHRSKHQKFMYELTISGKSLVDIQTEWHNYYVSLPDDEKRQVWKEFNSLQHSFHAPKPQNSHQPVEPATKEAVVTTARLSDLPNLVAEQDTQRSVGEIKQQLIKKVSADGKLTPVHHLKSLFFGIGLAGIFGLILTFTFFNEVFIAPLISPSKAVSATPIIGADSGVVGPEPKIIIPKINLEVPVVYDLGSVQEDAIQTALESGVVHYDTTPNPGEQGNAVIVGHSSNNILNRGKYKFAFVLLKRLENEDTFFVHKDGIRYTYKIYRKEIVGPDEVSVLETQDRANTITLITCDPPGTSINRLIIVAEQISPDPAANKPSSAATAPATAAANEPLPSNAPSLWSRLWPF